MCWCLSLLPLSQVLIDRYNFPLHKFIVLSIWFETPQNATFTNMPFWTSLMQTPSMRQLHLHVISQDFNSKHLRNKKHWNSFTTAFFRDSVDVMEEISGCGKARLEDDDKVLSMELRCHRCRSAHPSIPRLKSHITTVKLCFRPVLLRMVV